VYASICAQQKQYPDSAVNKPKSGNEMIQRELVGEGIKMLLEGNVLAVISKNELETVSSAIYNGGGIKKTKAILNVQVTREYGDKILHENPKAFILASAKKVLQTTDFVGMITAAAVKNFALASKADGELSVSVIATSADDEGNTCSHSETAGEIIKVQPIEGTINIIVIINGNPTESSLVSCIITATEAKTAAIQELDIRSRYSGDTATGTVTDAIVVAKTGTGQAIVYAGPASKLGQLVGYCTRKAVKEATMKGKECLPDRSIQKRLKERHLSVEKIASELAKVKCFGKDEKILAAKINELLSTDPVFAAMLLAASNLTEEFAQGRVPTELGNLEVLGDKFGSVQPEKVGFAKEREECGEADLPVFLKQALIAMLQSRL
jgi:adenosylcobinamide hydrolase